MATVVVMEDDGLLRDLAVVVLEMEGYSVKAFEDAGPALDEVDFDRVDLIITDLQMPTPGEEAIRAIRRGGDKPPIIVMSGNIDEDKAVELRNLGVQGIIEKPFEISGFLNLVEKWICDSPVEKEAELVCHEI